jgi:hypothetical protein
MVASVLFGVVLAKFAIRFYAQSKDSSSACQDSSRTHLTARHLRKLQRLSFRQRIVERWF